MRFEINATYHDEFLIVNLIKKKKVNARNHIEFNVSCSKLCSNHQRNINFLLNNKFFSLN